MSTKLDTLTAAFQGDQNAIDFAFMVCRIVSIWDDIVDGDDPSADDVTAAFSDCLFSLPLNPFYSQHQDVLRPILFNGVLNWLIANKIEAGHPELLEQSHVLRYSVADVVTMAAAIIGGTQHAVAYGPALRSIVMTDRLDSYIKEHTNA